MSDVWNSEFSCELSEESTKVFEELTKDVTVFTADKLHLVNKETGEIADFVSVKKLEVIIAEMEKYQMMEDKGIHFYHPPYYVERIIKMLKEVII